MQYARESHFYYNEWAAYGCKDWGCKDRFLNLKTSSLRNLNRLHTTDRKARSTPNELTAHFLAAGKELGSYLISLTTGITELTKRD